MTTRARERAGVTKFPPLPTTGFDDIDHADAAYRRLLDQHTAAVQRVRDLTGQRAVAANADEQAYADALRAGGKDPGRKHSEKLEADLAQATRERDALVRAVEDAAAALFGAVGRHRLVLADQYRARLVEARGRLVAALETLPELASDVAQLDAAMRTITRWPDRAPQPRANLHVDGQQVRLASVVGALRGFCEPEEPAPPAEWYAVDEAAALLRVSEGRVVRLLDTGRLEGEVTWRQSGPEGARRHIRLTGPSVRRVADELLEARYTRR